MEAEASRCEDTELVGRRESPKLTRSAEIFERNRLLRPTFLDSSFFVVACGKFLALAVEKTMTPQLSCVLDCLKGSIYCSSRVKSWTPLPERQRCLSRRAVD